ncbi:hypothetical protein BIW11_02039 [Tropilaelaps mercedesae]|uniref:RING-type domain-containing protein n=1 Tax=Tropilaelaps mercedesae TaxID=418985 RepID=A0A1V9X405_9ACAR|nr:hypothetical protein BIW11_02039 [Tropilaelaps mercedesae]
MMFLRELPQELCPGRIPLTPLDRAARFVTPCDACGDFTPRRIIVLCGHIFCSSCCRIQESPEGVQLYCSVCKQNSIGERNELSEHFLKSMRFACSCGQEGNLLEIKEHLAKGDVDHTLLDEGETQNVVTEENPVLKVRGDQTPARVGSITYIANKSKAYFCFELQAKIEDFMQSKLPQETKGVAWLTADYPIEVFCKIATFAGDCFLGTYIRMLNDHPSYSGWPVKKTISFELYNTRGDSVQKKEAATFVNGKPVWKGFTFACKPNGNKGWGFKKFCNLDKLVAPEEHLLCNGTVCVSIELQDLEGV